MVIQALKCKSKQIFFSGIRNSMTFPWFFPGNGIPWFFHIREIFFTFSMTSLISPWWWAPCMRSNDTPTHHEPAISVSQLGRLPVMMTSGSWSWRLALAVSLLLRNSWLPRILWLRGVCNTMGQKWQNGSTLMVHTYSDASKLICCNLSLLSLKETGTRLQKCKAPVNWSRSHLGPLCVYI